MPSHADRIAALTSEVQSITAGRTQYKTKEDALKAGVADLKKQIAQAKKQIDTLSDIAAPLGASAISVWLKKDKAHLANREKLLREVEKELSDEQAKSA